MQYAFIFIYLLYTFSSLYDAETKNRAVMETSCMTDVLSEEIHMLNISYPL